MSCDQRSPVAGVIEIEGLPIDGHCGLRRADDDSQLDHTLRRLAGGLAAQSCPRALGGERCAHRCLRRASAAAVPAIERPADLASLRRELTALHADLRKMTAAAR